ncbi:16S rRNA (guanine(527)-N(7))-methyltransferase RsmG [Breoghania sp. L-A4]|nr:16S rRNA (guanine(527)-N(7))-methyltransferase RsmG [Breoghania sp. L-A4]AXS38807.1 16S rRNA (guanine(527)-N(7))-methyltransferase RsmG [Breoghania sp. L-A4]
MISVSRETRERLEAYVALLRRWQPAQNLVSASTLDAVWTRHVADSAQLYRLAPDARRWIDFGSGAGFPGLVTAILLAGKADASGAMVHLVESNQRKVAFLRTVIRETGIPATVHAGRIDSVTKDWSEPIDAVSARALADLDQLCGFAQGFVARGARAFFHKGREYRAEIEKASHAWELDLVEKVSLVDPDSVILEVSRIAARGQGKGVSQ